MSKSILQRRLARNSVHMEFTSAQFREAVAFVAFTAAQFMSDAMNTASQKKQFTGRGCKMFCKECDETA